MGLHFYFCLCIWLHFDGIIQDAKDSFQFIPTPPPPSQNLQSIFKHREKCHSFPIALLRVSTIASGPCTDAFARNTQHICASSNHPWRNTLFLGGVKYFLGEEGADWELKQLCCFAVLICFETCLTCGDWLMRKAGYSLVNACGFFGKTVHSCRDRVQSVFLCEAVQIRCHRDLVWKKDNLKCSFNARWLELIRFYVKRTSHELCEKGRREQRQIFFLGVHTSC